MKSVILPLILSLLLISCEKEHRTDCFKSAGDTETEIRVLEKFDRLEVSDDIEVIIIQDSISQAEITTGKNLIDGIITEVKNSTLFIEETNRCNWVRKFSIQKQVKIYIPNLETIRYMGSKTLTFEEQFITDKLIVNLWDASGDLTLNVKTRLLELKTNTGTGTLTGIGETQELVCFNGAVGFVKTNNLKAKKVLAVNENVGSIEIGQAEELNIFIRGGGDIKYVGNPKIQSEITGSGKLIQQ